MKLIIYWFRNDLRLADNLGFYQACSDGDCLLPIAISSTKNNAITKWGFERMGPHRRQFEMESYQDLKAILQMLGSDLYVFEGNTFEILASLAARYKDVDIYCQQIEAPEEKAEIQKLKGLGIVVREFWQSSMLDPDDLPFKLDQMPDVFTQFRKQVEASNLRCAVPLDAPTSLPPMPATRPDETQTSLNFNSSKVLAFKGVQGKRKRTLSSIFFAACQTLINRPETSSWGRIFQVSFHPG